MTDRTIPEKVVYLPVSPDDLMKGEVVLTEDAAQKTCVVHLSLASLQQEIQQKYPKEYALYRFIMRPLLSFSPVKHQHTGNDTLYVYGPCKIPIQPLEGLPLVDYRTIYHGSSYHHDTLYPGVYYTGEIRYWDVDQSNEYLYATDDREGAIQMAFASLLERHYPVDRFKVAGKQIQVYLASGKLPTLQQVSKRPLYLYTLLHQKLLWEKVKSKQSFNEWRTRESLSYDILSCEPIDLTLWLKSYSVVFQHTPAREKVKYLYFYDTRKHSTIKTPEALKIVEPEQQAREIEEAAFKGRVAPSYKQLICFFEPLPIEYLGTIFGQDHPVWTEGRVVFEHRIQVSDLSDFTYEILETAEMRQFDALLEKASPTEQRLIYQDRAKTQRYRDLTGTGLHDFQNAALPYVAESTRAFLNFPKHPSYRLRFDDYCPTVPHVVLTPKKGEVPVDEVKRCVVGTKPIPKQKKPVYSAW